MYTLFSYIYTPKRSKETYIKNHQAVQVIRKVIQKARGDVETAEQKRKRQQVLAQAAHDNQQLPPNPYADFPGALSATGEPRHDNDFEHIDDISILPTHDEVYSERQPYIPKNNKHCVHHLADDPVARLFDTQFRLLREDLTRSIRHGVTELTSLMQTKEGIDMLAKKSLFRHKDGQGTFLFHNPTLDSISVQQRGGKISPQYVLHFDQLPDIKKKNKKDLEQFWTRTKRLQVGSMICICSKTLPKVEEKEEEEANDIQVRFGVVVSREVDQLARDRPKVAVYAVDANNNFNQDFLSTLMNTSNPNQYSILLQVSGSYFSYEPVLRALKTNYRNSNDFPFAKELCYWKDDDREQQEQQQQQLPRYYADGPILMDLQPIMKRNEAHHIRIQDGTEWEAAAAHSNLDGSQFRALQGALTSPISLIQGPPGTGKSYVGVQIVRTLLHNFGDTLGPVLCLLH